MHTLQLSLKTTSYDNHQIVRRFHAVSHIHNVTVKRAIKLMNQLKRDKAYCSYLSEYASIKKKEKLSSADKKRLKALSKLMSDIRYLTAFMRTPSIIFDLGGGNAVKLSFFVF